MQRNESNETTWPHCSVLFNFNVVSPRQQLSRTKNHALPQRQEVLPVLGRSFIATIAKNKCVAITRNLNGFNIIDLYARRQ